MRLDPRLPWSVLVDHVLQEWRDSFLARTTALEPAGPIDPVCLQWRPRITGTGRLRHRHYHWLVDRLDALRTSVQREVAIGLAQRGSRRADTSVPRSVLPRLTPAQQVRLDARMAEFDAIVDAHLADLPSAVRDLGERARRERREILASAAQRAAADAVTPARTAAAPLPSPAHDRTTSPSPARRPRPEPRQIASAITGLYSHLGLDAPVILWARSPNHAEAIAEALSDLCTAATAEPRGFPEIVLGITLADHRDRLDTRTQDLLTAAAHRVLDTSDPVAQLLPVTAAFDHLRAGCLLDLAHRLGVDEGILAVDLPSMSTAVAARTDPTAAARAVLVPAVEQVIDRELAPRLPRAIATDPWVEPDVFDELDSRVRTRPPGLAEVLTLRSGLYSWSGTRGIALLTESPVEVHLDAEGRLHHGSGPAARWSDGWGVHLWHGTLVPADLVEEGWTISRTFAEHNVEVRRCAIERMGWETFVAGAGLRRVGAPAPDPANPGFDLTLYELPAGLIDDDEAGLLLCTNASPERDGTRRRYGLTVPAHFRDPIAAAAWTFGLSRAQYATLEFAS